MITAAIQKKNNKGKIRRYKLRKEKVGETFIKNAGRNIKRPKRITKKQKKDGDDIKKLDKSSKKNMVSLKLAITQKKNNVVDRGN